MQCGTRLVQKSCTTPHLVLGKPLARTAKLRRWEKRVDQHARRRVKKYVRAAQRRNWLQLRNRRGRPRRVPLPTRRIPGLPPLRGSGLHPPAETHPAADKSLALTVSRGARIFREVIRTNRCADTRAGGHTRGGGPAIHTRAQRSGDEPAEVAPVVHRVVLPGLTIPRWVRSFPRLRVGP
jgi:hypothetical protein